MMTSMPCKPSLLINLVLAGCLGLSACAVPSGLFTSGNAAPPFRDAAMSMQSARDMVVAGTSSKADVIAALGSGNVVSFDSGFEVWVYRAKAAGTATDSAEFVILFAPSGIVKKTRIRPPYDGREN